MEVSFNKAFRMFSTDEAVRYYPYDDATGKPVKAPKGNLTVGIGHNLDARPLSAQVVMMILREDVEQACREVKAVVGEELWSKLSENRRLGLINLTFNVGRAGLQTFIKFLSALQKEDWVSAGAELRNSLWARQVDPVQLPNRGRDDRVIKLIEEDIYGY